MKTPFRRSSSFRLRRFWNAWREPNPLRRRRPEQDSTSVGPFLVQVRVFGMDNPRDSELRKIVASSSSKNRTAGITGGLMFNRSYFGQVLEGERNAVSELFTLIAGDVRHKTVVIVEAVEVRERLFERWSMGFAERTETSDALNAKYGLNHGFDPSGMSAKSFLAYVLEMVTEDERLITVSVPTFDNAKQAVSESRLLRHLPNPYTLETI
jgi:hypothetical protein